MIPTPAERLGTCEHRWSDPGISFGVWLQDCNGCGVVLAMTLSESEKQQVPHFVSPDYKAPSTCATCKAPVTGDGNTGWTHKETP